MRTRPDVAGYICVHWIGLPLRRQPFVPCYIEQTVDCCRSRPSSRSTVVALFVTHRPRLTLTHTPQELLHTKATNPALSTLSSSRASIAGENWSPRLPSAKLALVLHLPRECKYSNVRRTRLSPLRLSFASSTHFANPGHQSQTWHPHSHQFLRSPHQAPSTRCLSRTLSLFLILHRYQKL